jgi:hypothetical protein
MLRHTRSAYTLLMLACMVVLFWAVTPEMSQANAASIKGFGLCNGWDCTPAGTSCVATNPCNSAHISENCLQCLARAGQLCASAGGWLDLCWDDAGAPATCIGKYGPCQAAAGMGYTCAGTQERKPDCGTGNTCWW